MLFFVCLSAATMPLDIAFELNRNYLGVLLLLIVFDIFFILDFVLSFFTAIPIGSTFIKEPRLIAAHYIKKRTTWFAFGPRVCPAAAYISTLWRLRAIGSCSTSSPRCRSRRSWTRAR